jgi:hypothetical protein
MKHSFAIASVLLALSLFSSPLLAAEKSSEKSAKQTCCVKAKAEKKECTHKCCVSAQRAGKTCEKCNPAKADSKQNK